MDGAEESVSNKRALENNLVAESSKKPKLEESAVVGSTDDSKPKEEEPIESESEEEASVGDEENSSCEEKEQPIKDPGVAVYEELRKCLRQLKDMASMPEQNDESMERIRAKLDTLAQLVTSQAQDGEIPNPLKLLQMNLKYILFNSKDIKDVLNIKNFVSSLEDMSANKSDENDKVYVFLAMHATELWYRWKEEEGHWEWTPEADHWLWMPCSTNVVTDGGWKGEVPAPENVQIIHYLNIVRPLPYNQQYISASYNVAQLLCQLNDMGNKEIQELVKKVASTVISLDKIPAADIDIVINTLKQFNDLLAENES